MDVIALPGRPLPDYGSEGWGFESLRAHLVIRSDTKAQVSGLVWSPRPGKRSAPTVSTRYSPPAPGSPSGRRWPLPGSPRRQHLAEGVTPEHQVGTRSTPSADVGTSSGRYIRSLEAAFGARWRSHTAAPPCRSPATTLGTLCLRLDGERLPSPPGYPSSWRPHLDLYRTVGANGNGRLCPLTLGKRVGGGVAGSCCWRAQNAPIWTACDVVGLDPASAPNGAYSARREG